MISILLITLFLLNLSVKRTYAYLDPGTGSYMLQVTIGGLLGAIFVIKTYWHSIKAKIIKPKTKSTSHETPEASD